MRTVKINQFVLTFILCAHALLSIATETAATITHRKSHQSTTDSGDNQSGSFLRRRNKTTFSDNDIDITIVSSNITRNQIIHNSNHSIQQQQRLMHRQNQHIQPKQGQGQRERRLAWGWDETPCGITGFSMYNKRRNKWDPLLSVFIDGTYQSLILLDKYEGGKINIQVHVTNAGCPEIEIECVRIKLGTIQDKEEREEPYTLYHWTEQTEYTEQPDETGLQSLEAWAYDTSTCSGQEICYEQTDLLLIPDSSDVITLYPITAVYLDTDELLPPIADTLAVVSATCEYIKNALTHPDSNNYFLHVQGSLQFDPDAQYECNYSLTENIVPIRMTYHIRTTYRYTSDISLYSNPLLLPAQADISEYIKGLFRNEYGNAVTGKYMRQYVRRTIDPSNVYYNYTTIDVFDVPN